jgi:hypothetical protein
MKSTSIWTLTRLLVPTLVYVCCISGETKTIYVSPTGDGTSGVSWQTAFQTINSAHSSCSNGDTIWIESATYKETLMIRDHSVHLIGGFNGNSNIDQADLRPNGEKSVLDGSGIPTNVITTFRDVSLIGLVLKNSPSSGLATQNTTLVVKDCLLENNIHGGGVYIESSTVEFRNCTIANNQCDREAGGISAYFGSNVIIDSCTIENNEGVYRGGIDGGKILIISNSVIRGNRTLGDGIIGGGIDIRGLTQLTNCLIYGNQTEYAPGAQISVRGGGTCQITSCTILGSQDEVYTDIEGENPFIIDNSILWGAPGILKSGAQVFNSCIQGGYNGLGNISNDPLFRNAAAGDYRLVPESPCIDTAGTSGPDDDLNGNPRPVDIAGIGREVTDTYDMGAYEFQLNELPTPTPTQTPSQVDPGHTGLYQ